MLTIFTLPKPFRGHIGMIQRNALRSWLALRPECEIILLGDEEGIAEHAKEFGVRHIPDIARNEYGTPLLSDAFSQVARSACFPRLCYVNADIILPKAFLSCVQRIALPRFLMIGQRITISADSELDFRDDSVARAVQTEARQSGTLDAPFGSDYFVFPRGTLGPIPPFAVGRPYWDNWMIYRARELHVPVVDASECVLVIHQDHSYGHVPQRAGERWEGPEAERNKRLVTQAAQHFTVRHASWRLQNGRLAKRHWWHGRDRDDVFDSTEVFKPWTHQVFWTMRLLMRRWDRRLISMLLAAVDGHGIHGTAADDPLESPAPSLSQPESGPPRLNAERLRAMWPSSARGRWMTAEHRPRLVSVIIPAYQRVGMISTSLDSVRAQTYRPLELVVVDDGSTDGTTAAVESWSDSLPADPGFTVRVICQENAGPPAARNTGLKHCTGEFIQFLDSDDLVHPEKVRAQVESLGRDDRIDVTYARTAYFTQAPDWSAEPYVTFPETDDRLLDAFLLGGCWLPASGLFRRRTCVALGPWDEAAPILEDWDYSIRLILGGAHLDFASDTFLLYRHDHLARPTVTGRQLSPRSLRGRYLLTIRWLSWIRDAGRLDQDIAFLFSDQLIDLAIASLSAGQAALARDIIRSLRREHLGAPVSRRAERAYFVLAELPEWCSSALLQVLRHSLELKQIVAEPHRGAGSS